MTFQAPVPQTSLADRLDTMDQRISTLEKSSSSAPKNDLPADFLDRVKFVLEKYFPHDLPPKPLKPAAGAEQPKFVPMLDATGRPMTDPMSGNPIYRPADPNPTL